MVGLVKLPGMRRDKRLDPAIAPVDGARIGRSRAVPAINRQPRAASWAAVAAVSSVMEGLAVFFGADPLGL